MWSAQLWQRVRWLGVEVWQWPTDLLIMQELIFEQKPKFIVETGTAHGGSSIFYASMLELMGGGQVISIDVKHSDEVRQRVEEHQYGSKVTLITADSCKPDTLAKIREILGDETNVLVALDSDHSYAHVRDELDAYQHLVPVGGNLVVFDTVMSLLGTMPGYGSWKQDNPLRAVDEFLAGNSAFVRDESRERLMISFCGGGFLKRVSA